MKLEFEGAVWEVDFFGADMQQADKIASYTGLSLMGWYKSLLDTDSPAWNKAIRCLYWLMREQNPQNGGSVPLDGNLNFRPVPLFEALNEAMTPAAETAEADPTLPAAPPAAEGSAPPPTPPG